MHPFYASKTPKELRNEWGTPDCIFQPIRQRYKLVVDTASNALNAKLPVFFTDALGLDWEDYCLPNHGLWCNPPFSNVDPWAKKWIKTADKRTVVAIVNSQTGAYWYHEAMEACTTMQFSRGRVGFIHPVTGKPVSENNLGQTIFTFEVGHLGEQRLEHFDCKDYNKRTFIKPEK